MQNSIYKYNKYYQPSIRYDGGIYPKFEKALKSFNNLYSVEPPEVTFKTYIPWELPYHKVYKNPYRTTFELLSKYIGVKLMYRQLLISNQIVKGFYIIGDHSRVMIWKHIMEYILKGLFIYHNHIKRSNPSLNSSTSSKLLGSQLESINKLIKKVLVEDKKFESDLEIFILGQFKLDFKDYNQESNLYYHAISKRFHHKSMLS